MLNGAGPFRDMLKPTSSPSPLDPLKKLILTAIKRVVGAQHAASNVQYD